MNQHLESKLLAFFLSHAMERKMAVSIQFIQLKSNYTINDSIMLHSVNSTAFSNAHLICIRMEIFTII